MTGTAPALSLPSPLRLPGVADVEEEDDDADADNDGEEHEEEGGDCTDTVPAVLRARGRTSTMTASSEDDGGDGGDDGARFFRRLPMGWGSRGEASFSP